MSEEAGLGDKFVQAYKNPITGKVSYESIGLPFDLPPEYNNFQKMGDNLVAIPEGWDGDTSKLKTIIGQKSTEDALREQSLRLDIPKSPTPVLASAKEAVSKGAAGLQEREVNWLADRYRSVAGTTQKSRNVLAKSEARGKDPAQFLAEHNIRPDVRDGKIDSAVKADALHQSADPLNEHLDLALKEIQPSIPFRKLSDIEEQAVKLARTDKNIAANTADDLESGIRVEFATYRKNFGDSISLLDENAIKRAKWGITKFDANKPLQGDVNYLIGKAAKQDIEAAVPEGAFSVKELNSHIGDIYDAEKFLRALDGKAVKGGRLGKYFGRTLGGMVGATHGPVGTFFGVLGGDFVVELLQQATFSNPLKQMILRNLQKADPEGYAKAMEFIKRAKLEQTTRPLLPAADKTRSTINDGRPIPVLPSGKEGVDYVGRDTTVGDYLRPR